MHKFLPSFHYVTSIVLAAFRVGAQLISRDVVDMIHLHLHEAIHSIALQAGEGFSKE